MILWGYGGFLLVGGWSQCAWEVQSGDWVVFWAVFDDKLVFGVDLRKKKAD